MTRTGISIYLLAFLLVLGFAVNGCRKKEFIVDIEVRNTGTTGLYGTEIKFGSTTVFSPGYVGGSFSATSLMCHIPEVRDVTISYYEQANASAPIRINALIIEPVDIGSKIVLAVDGGAKSCQTFVERPVVRK